MIIKDKIMNSGGAIPYYSCKSLPNTLMWPHKFSACTTERRFVTSSVRHRVLGAMTRRLFAAGAAAWRHGGGVGSGGAEPARTLLTRLGIRKPSVSGLSPHPRAARTFSLDDLLKPPPGRKERARFARALRTDAAYHSRSYHSLLLCDFRLHPVLI